MALAYVLCLSACLFEVSLGLAPPLALPPTSFRARPSPAIGATPPSGRGPAKFKSLGASRFGGLAPKTAAPVSVVGLDRMEVESQLKEILASTSRSITAKYYEADVLGISKLENGDPSLGALVELLGASMSSPFTFDKNELIGDWTLAYSNDLPSTLREELKRHIDYDFSDLSVMLSVSNTGDMTTRAVISLLNGAKHVMTLKDVIMQHVLSSSLTSVRQDGDRMSVQMMYQSSDLLVLRQGYPHRLGTKGLAPAKTEVWRRSPEPTAKTPLSTGRTSLWRFGIPLDTQGASDVYRGTTSVFKACVFMGVLGVTVAAMASVWRRRFAVLDRQAPEVLQMATKRHGEEGLAAEGGLLGPELLERRIAVAAFAGSVNEDSYTTISVPVRGGAHKIAMKRYFETRTDGGLPRMLPAVLVVHGGPGLPSRYLEPLGARLCAPVGRPCYMYDQLGCGLSRVEGDEPLGGYGFEQSIRDLRDILRFLSESLGETAVHIVAHGAGGIIVMEGLLRGGLLWKPTAEVDLPTLRSICLLSVPSSTELAEAEAKRLMDNAMMTVGKEDAVRCFWYQHICALKPQPEVLKEAYDQKARPGWYGFGALRGWNWDLKAREFKLQGNGVLHGWSLERDEVARLYAAVASGVPLMNIRGRHDFVTEPCIDSWRGVKDAFESTRNGEEEKKFPMDYREEVVHGCGHNAHLEDKESVAALLRIWLLDVEENLDSRKYAASIQDKNSACAQPPSSVSMMEDGLFHLLSRDEARDQLNNWASELSWREVEKLKLDSGPSVRAVGEGIPHRIARIGSKLVRRLANWAWNLPEDLPSSMVTTATGLDGVREAVRAKLDQSQCDVSDGSCMAVAVMKEKTESFQAIVCLEVREDVQASRVVGTVTAPDVPTGVGQAAAAQVEEAIGEIVGGQ